MDLARNGRGHAPVRRRAEPSPADLRRCDLRGRRPARRRCPRGDSRLPSTGEHAIAYRSARSPDMNAPVSTPPVFALRPEAEHAPNSGIVDVFNFGRGRQGLIPLWVGEGDLPTPSFICEAATRSLAAGETFYTYQRGIPELRQALVQYHERVYGRPSDPERFYVTSGGMPAAMMAIRMVAGTGDEVLIPTPAWPNFVGAITVAGARPVGVPLAICETGWRLDIDR